MSHSLRATLSARFDIREIADSSVSPASAEGGNQLTFTQYSIDAALNANTFPPIGGRVIDISKTLSGTTADIDLTAAPLAADVSQTVDLTGAKLVGLILRTNKANNPAGLTFGPQGGNGYALWGASKTLVLYRGKFHLEFYFDPLGVSLSLDTPVVGGSAKDLRFTGTSGDIVKGLAIFNQ
jgi:hypothetical protein